MGGREPKKLEKVRTSFMDGPLLHFLSNMTKKFSIKQGNKLLKNWVTQNDPYSLYFAYIDTNLLKQVK